MKMASRSSVRAASLVAGSCSFLKSIMGTDEKFSAIFSVCQPRVMKSKSMQFSTWDFIVDLDGDFRSIIAVYLSQHRGVTTHPSASGPGLRPRHSNYCHHMSDEGRDETDTARSTIGRIYLVESCFNTRPICGLRTEQPQLQSTVEIRQPAHTFTSWQWDAEYHVTAYSY